MICVPITEATWKEALKAANSIEADALEFRLDYLKDFGCLAGLKGINKPIIVSCMPEWEGGRFTGNEKERVGLLIEFLDNCDYVTIELNTEAQLRDKLVKEAKKKGVKVIVSSHDFEKTPTKEGIKKILRREKQAGADIVKVAFTAKSYNDALRTMEVLLDKGIGIPVIAVSMGSYGKISRVLGPLFGSYLTYAAAKKGKESAPGQLTVEETKKVLGVLK